MLVLDARPPVWYDIFDKFMISYLHAYQWRNYQNQMNFHEAYVDNAPVVTSVVLVYWLCPIYTMYWSLIPD